MELVVDANILFAALIKDGVTAELLLNDGLVLFAPEFLFVEFAAYREALLAKTRIVDFEAAFEVFAGRITLVPQDAFASSLEAARRLSPDGNDVPYLALALEMGIPLWSQDKALKERQTRIRILTTADILKL